MNIYQNGTTTGSPSPRRYGGHGSPTGVHEDPYASYVRDNQEVEIGALKSQLAFYVEYFKRHQQDIVHRSCSPEIPGIAKVVVATSDHTSGIDASTVSSPSLLFDDLHSLRLALHLANGRVEAALKEQAVSSTEREKERNALLKEIDTLSDENDELLESYQASQARIRDLERELESIRGQQANGPLSDAMSMVGRGGRAMLQMTEAMGRVSLEHTWMQASLSLSEYHYTTQGQLTMLYSLSAQSLNHLRWFRGFLPAPGTAGVPTPSHLSSMIAFGMSAYVNLLTYQPPTPSRPPAAATTTTSSSLSTQHFSPAGVSARQRLLAHLRDEETIRQALIADDVKYHQAAPHHQYNPPSTTPTTVGPTSPIYAPYYAISHMTPIPLENSTHHNSVYPSSSSPVVASSSSSPPKASSTSQVRSVIPTTTTPSVIPTTTTPSVIPTTTTPSVIPTTTTPSVIPTTTTPSVIPTTTTPSVIPTTTTPSVIPPTPGYLSPQRSLLYPPARVIARDLSVKDLRVEAMMRERLDAAEAVREAQWGTRTAARIVEGVSGCELDRGASQSIARAEEAIEESLRRYRSERRVVPTEDEGAPSVNECDDDVQHPAKETAEEESQRLEREKEEEALREKLFERVTKAKNELLVLEKISKTTGDPSMRQRFQRQMRAMHEFLLEDEFATGVSVVLEEEESRCRSMMNTTEEEDVVSSSAVVEQRQQGAELRRSESHRSSTPAKSKPIVHSQPFMLSASDAKKFEASSAKTKIPPPKRGPFRATTRTGNSPSRSPKRRAATSVVSPSSAVLSPTSPSPTLVSPQHQSPVPRGGSSSTSPNVNEVMSSGAEEKSVVTTSSDFHVRALLREAQDELHRESFYRLQRSSSCVADDEHSDTSKRSTVVPTSI